MGTGANVKPGEREAADHPMVLFFALLHGRRTGDFQMAARAKRRLGEKGIRVTFTRRRVRRGRPMPTNGPDRPIGALDRIPAGRLALSVAEAGALIGVSPRQIYTLAHKAGLPTIKLLGRRLVRRADLECWIASQPVDCVDACRGPQGGAP